MAFNQVTAAIDSELLKMCPGGWPGVLELLQAIVSVTDTSVNANPTSWNCELIGTFQAVSLAHDVLERVRIFLSKHSQNNSEQVSLLPSYSEIVSQLMQESHSIDEFISTIEPIDLESTSNHDHDDPMTGKISDYDKSTLLKLDSGAGGSQMTDTSMTKDSTIPTFSFDEYSPEMLAPTALLSSLSKDLNAQIKSEPLQAMSKPEYESLNMDDGAVEFSDNVVNFRTCEGSDELPTIVDMDYHTMRTSLGRLIPVEPSNDGKKFSVPLPTSLLNDPFCTVTLAITHVGHPLMAAISGFGTLDDIPFAHDLCTQPPVKKELKEKRHTNIGRRRSAASFVRQKFFEAYASDHEQQIDVIPGLDPAQRSQDHDYFSSDVTLKKERKIKECVGELADGTQVHILDPDKNVTPLEEGLTEYWQQPKSEELEERIDSDDPDVPLDSSTTFVDGITADSTRPQKGKAIIIKTADSILTDIPVESMDGENFQCSLCSFVTRSRQMLNEHAKNRHSIKQVQCASCLHMFPHERALKRHEMFVHAPHVMCPICFLSVKRNLLTSHLRVAHANDKAKSNMFLCDTCGDMFVSKESLQAHNLGKHGISMRSKTMKECSQCNKMVASNLMTAHIKQVHSSHVYACAKCRKIYKTKSSFNLHQKMHQSGEVDQETEEVEEEDQA